MFFSYLTIIAWIFRECPKNGTFRFKNDFKKFNILHAKLKIMHAKLVRMIKLTLINFSKHFILPNLHKPSLIHIIW